MLALALAARHPQTPWYAKLFLLVIVAYALSPIDLIPDFIPVIGLLDEIILLPFALVLAVKLVPPPVLEQCRAQARIERPAGARFGRAGATAIVLLWILLALLGALWVYRELG